MPEAKLILKEPKSSESTLIYAILRYNYQRFKYSTGEKISPQYWDAKSQIITQTKKFKNHVEINTRINNIANALENAYRKLLNDKINITNDKLKEELEIALEITEKKKHITFFEFIDKYIEEGKGVKTVGSIKVYRTTQRHLKDYVKFKNITLDFEHIDLDFYNSFIYYLMHEAKLSTNTIGKHIKTVKAFLNDATDRGLNDNLEFRKKKFKGFREDADKIYLSNNEIDILGDLDLSKLPYLERTRDLFLIGCFTGLRFSDYTQIKKENIIESNKLKIKSQKTNETVVIPIHSKVQAILEKYNFELPKPITNQKTNEYLKVVGEMAELNEIVESSITKGGTRIKSTVPKYQLISSHTARRSFATNLYLADVPAITIMKITGHKSEKVFLQYIRVTQEQNANKLLNHPFFK